ncbi:MAG: MarR family winged helix-turn-helix transcriptional regulator [Bacillota bacterium]
MNNKKIDYGKENNINLKLDIGLSRSYRALCRSTQRLMSNYNLTMAQFGVLEVLYHLGELKICEIIQKTLSTSGNMTVVIKNLEKEGLVSRNQSKEDTRASIVGITQKGKELIERIFPDHMENIDKRLMRLNYDEKSELLRLLKKMNGVD